MKKVLLTPQPSVAAPSQTLKEVENDYRSIQQHNQTASLGKLSLVVSKVTLILNTHLAHLEKKKFEEF